MKKSIIAFLLFFACSAYAETKLIGDTVKIPDFPNAETLLSFDFTHSEWQVGGAINCLKISVFDVKAGYLSSKERNQWLASLSFELQKVKEFGLTFKNLLPESLSPSVGFWVGTDFKKEWSYGLCVTVAKLE